MGFGGILDDKRQGDEFTAVRQPAGMGLPSSSWWLGLSREEVSARAKAERARMQTSRFGRIARPIGSVQGYD